MGTPIDVKYATPEQASPYALNPYLSPRQDSNTIMAMPIRPMQEQQNYRFKWGGLTKDDVEEIHHQGHLLEDRADWDRAEEKFREALAGCQFLLSPTHRYTRHLVYHLASFYFEHDRVADADVLLDWMTERIALHAGITDEIFVQHLLKISELLRKWSRIDEAKSFGKRIYDVLTIPEQGIYQTAILASIPRINNHTHPPIRDIQTQASQDFVLSVRYDAADVDPQIEILLESQLSLAWTYVEDNDGGVEQCLQALIEQCDKRSPKGFSAQLLKARSALAALYHRLGRSEELDETLSGTEAAFARISGTDYKEREDILEIATEASKVHFMLGKEDFTSRLLNELVSGAADALGPTNDKIIGVLIDIGIWFQDQSRWDYARPRFEQALAATLSQRVPQCVLVQRLEKALDERYYELLPDQPCRCFGALSEGLGSCVPWMWRLAVADAQLHAKWVISE